MKPTTTSLLLTDTLKVGTEIETASSPFKNTDGYNTYVDQIELKYDGDDVLYTGFLIEFYHPPYDGVRRSEYSKRNDFLT